MKATIQKWGNSLAVRIPKSIAQQIGVREHDPVELHPGPDGLLLRPAPPRFTLAELVSQITPANRHAETDWGKTAGREVW